MEWTIQQIIITFFGVLVAGLIIYYAFKQIMMGGPTPNVESNVLPIATLGLSYFIRRTNKWTR